jgi:hypothetical protein
LTGTGAARETELDRAEFEYRLLNRSKKRSAEEAAWNELRRKGWELVVLTDAKRRLRAPALRARIRSSRNA